MEKNKDKEAGKVLDYESKTENEKKKEFLRSYQEERKTLARLEAQLAELLRNKIPPAAVSVDGMPHSNGVTYISDYAAKMDEIEQNIIKARYEQLCALQRVQYRIEAMSDERRIYLHIVICRG